MNDRGQGTEDESSHFVQHVSFRAPEAARGGGKHVGWNDTRQTDVPLRGWEVGCYVSGKDFMIWQSCRMPCAYSRPGQFLVWQVRLLALHLEPLRTLWRRHLGFGPMQLRALLRALLAVEPVIRKASAGSLRSEWKGTHCLDRRRGPEAIVSADRPCKCKT